MSKGSESIPKRSREDAERKRQGLPKEREVITNGTPKDCQRTVEGSPSRKRKRAPKDTQKDTEGIHEGNNIHRVVDPLAITTFATSAKLLLVFLQLCSTFSSTVVPGVSFALLVGTKCLKLFLTLAAIEIGNTCGPNVFLVTGSRFGNCQIRLETPLCFQTDL